MSDFRAAISSVPKQFAGPAQAILDNGLHAVVIKVST
jgi:hypothetical protein